MKRYVKQLLIIFVVLFLIVIGVLNKTLIQNFLIEVVNYLGLYGIFFLAFLLDICFFQPISPAIFLILIVVSDQFHWFTVFLVITFGSLSGSVVDYILGKYYGEKVLNVFISKEKIQKVEQLFQKYSHYAILFGAFTPIPYNLVCWCSGMSKIPFLKFISFAFVSRTCLFLILSILSYYGLLSFLF